VQSPGNLGITADTLLRRIKRIELIADNEGFFQVYLFQLVSVTVADARALATSFRNRAGNFLLVLTADFDRLDFVFVERIPVEGQTSTIGTPQPKVRPRTISVERRKPERVQLRVLRRFTWTEADAFAQYEKLLAAYSVAYWSEDHFNNRALFSDYFLKERLPNSPIDFPEWTEDPKPAYKRLHDIYTQALSGLTGKTKESLRSELLEPVLSELGFRIEAGAKTSDPGEPDYRMYAPSDGSGPVALCLAYPWDRFLDGKDDKRDAETPDHNPGQRVVSLLEKAEALWIVVTNGRLWRLYSPRAQSRASNYYEIELDEALGQIALHPSGPAEGFRYFWLLFRCQSFERIPFAGEAKPRSLLDRLFDGSQQYAAELGESLKERVFEQIFRLLAEGFIANIREREGRTTALSQERLDAIFQGVLTLLYRLLFLLYAEARDLLPVRETLEYSGVSISAIKREVADVAGSLEDTVASRLKKQYRLDSHSLYDRMARLFGVVDRGDTDLNVPAYNGGLFISKTRPTDESAEANAARFLADHKVPDLFLAQALDSLARDEDPKTHQLVPIDFKSLGVRQLGSIYEGLLEFRLRIAEEKKAIVKEKGREVFVTFKDLDERERERAESQERIVRKGDVYLENDKGERKATGSYYTPDHIVNYIVEYAVGPVVREKFETMRQRLREAERWHRDSIQAAKAKGEKPAKYETGPAVDNRWRDLVNELFDLKILDPAMGSGHFLVETVDYITDKALDFLNSFPWNPIIAHLELVRRTILDEMDEQGITIDYRRLTDVNLLKRHVLKRCIYGVDLNPMAVELAKVSLWLHCFTLGAPLSFLDHHVRCGNSLVGVSVAQVEDELRQGSLFGSQFAGLLLATDLMRHVGELSDVTSAQVRESRDEYIRAATALAPFRRILDLFTTQWFRDEVRKPATRKRGQSIPEVEFLKTKIAEKFVNASSEAVARKAIEGVSTSERQIAERTLRISIEKRPFHWELEFPEVFYGPRPGTQRKIERLEGAGFDAVVGNPPYLRVQQMRQTDPAAADFLAQRYRTATKNFDIYMLFLELGLSLTKSEVMFIAPNKWFATDYGEGLRRFVVEKRALSRVVDFKDFQLFADATNYPCIIALSKVPRDEFAYIDASAGEIGSDNMRRSQSLPTDGGVWGFTDEAETALLQRLMSGDYPRLSSFLERAFQGLRTSDNGVYVFQGTKRTSKNTIWIQSRATGETHEIETALLKPLLSGDEIRAFSLSHNDQWILFPYEMAGTKPGLISENRFRKDFPLTWKYLKQCEERLRAREDGKMNGSGWWAFGRNQNLDQFEQPKVMLPDYNDKPAAGLDAQGKFYSITAYCLTLKDSASLMLPTLACLLNSRLMFWILSKTGTSLQRGFVRFMPQYLNLLPIVVPDRSDQASLNQIANAARERGFKTVQAELNAMVYRLYAVDEREIAVVERSDFLENENRSVRQER
jgi:Eco57I restriction-modification methylase/TaqI-like C-terminal specificity domain